jgi:hypothetical protein
VDIYPDGYARIRQLYQVEAEAKKIIAARALGGSDADAVHHELRQTQALVIVTSLCQWLQEEQPKVLPKSPMGQAIAYALRHWQALTRYLDDGFLDIDNNVAELTLRHIAIGRNYAEFLLMRSRGPICLHFQLVPRSLGIAFCGHGSA